VQKQFKDFVAEDVFPQLVVILVKFPPSYVCNF
jgi:hypothetical protein